MEATQISQFFDQLTIWPGSPAEMDLTADRISKLLEVPLVAVLSNRSLDSPSSLIPNEGRGVDSSPLATLKVGLRTQRLDGRVNPLDRQSLSEVLKKQLRFPPESFPGLQRTELYRTGVHSSQVGVLTGVNHLTWLHLVTSPPQGRKYLGSLVVGSAVPLSDEKETLLTMLAHHLIDLGQMADLEIAIQIRNQFLSIASHELKTPLTSIYGILQLQERMIRLKKDQSLFPDQERHHHFLKMVIRQVERLNDLIDGLLDVSRIQSGRFNVDPSDTDVAALLRDCVQSRLNVIAVEAGVKIQLDSVPKLMARIDPVRTEEVISNLIMNGIRFSPEGGVVWAKLREDGDAFRLTVRDQGPSISVEDRERIFQPFERVQRTARMGGLGLGLFISRQIALMHGGNVSLVESVPGKGNVLEAYFPIQAQRENEARSS